MFHRSSHNNCSFDLEQRDCDLDLKLTQCYAAQCTGVKLQVEIGETVSLLYRHDRVVSLLNIYTQKVNYISLNGTCLSDILLKLVKLSNF